MNTSIHSTGTPLLRVNPLKALVILLIATLVCVLIVSGIAGIMMPEVLTTRYMRVLAVLQDVFVFILPAAIMAVMVSTDPDRLLEIDRRPSTLWSLMGILALLTATPAMNLIVEWNEGIHLPQALSGVEEWFRTSENAAEESVKILMGGTKVSDLIMGILIIGVLAGVSEEIFFRGAILGALMQSRLNKHVAIWLTAVIFSVCHFQFFGFVPRVLLGAYFGYIVWWTGSVWVAAIIHAFNNSLIVTAEWLTRTGVIDYDINHAGTSSIALVIGSIILTAGVLRASLKHLGKKKETDPAE